jgi:hypothetical protein
LFWQSVVRREPSTKARRVVFNRVVLNRVVVSVLKERFSLIQVNSLATIAPRELSPKIQTAELNRFDSAKVLEKDKYGIMMRKITL